MLHTEKSNLLKYSCMHWKIGESWDKTTHNVIHTLEGHCKTIIGQAIERTNAHGGEATSTFAESAKCIANRIWTRLRVVFKCYKYVLLYGRWCIHLQYSRSQLATYTITRNPPPLAAEAASSTSWCQVVIHKNYRQLVIWTTNLRLPTCPMCIRKVPCDPAPHACSI